ncbi:MAG: nucleotidyltransferase domain-containing protein [archaeon]|nr:nucleotidyltransferase domain-containing protein [archaeon]
MVKKKISENEDISENTNIEKTENKITSETSPVKDTLKLANEREIAMDFAVKIYKQFDKMVKSVVLFGSSAKKVATPDSDIDIIIILDDVSIQWDQELIAWYREELSNILKANPYKKEIHINTIKLSTWWGDLMKGDPVVINVIRYGKSMIDLAGFFEPLKFLLLKGEIKSTPEAIYNCLQRAPMHISRSKAAELSSIEGLYWAMVDSSQAALIAAKVSPPSPEHIPGHLKEVFADSGKLKMKYIIDFRDLHLLHKKIMHGEIKDLRGVEIDAWQDKTKDFVDVMAQLVKELI